VQIGLWGREDQYKNNKIFFYENDFTGSKNNKKFILLKQFLETKNIFLNTLDTFDNNSEINVLIFLDYPLAPSKKSLQAFNSKIPKILITDENKFVRPAVWMKSNFEKFNYVMTIDDDFIDNIKFFEYGVSDHEKDLDLKFNIPNVDFSKKKLVTWITWNKSSFNKNINFSVRKEIIKWYEKNYPNDFDLYGPNWDELSFPYDSYFLKYLNYPRFKYLRKFFGKKYKTWRGHINDKKNIIKNYKFCFAFENTCKLNGYITEKIFDVFYSGSVPIYFGAKNIEKHIPKNCYIDFRNFENLEKLHLFLRHFKEVEYLAIKNNIYKFLLSQKSYKYTSKYFCEKIFQLIKLCIK
jgi:hypothetical protein